MTNVYAIKKVLIYLLTCLIVVVIMPANRLAKYRHSFYGLGNAGVAVQNVERSIRKSNVSGSCQKVSGSWRRLARRYAKSNSPERCSTYAHARRTGVI